MVEMMFGAGSPMWTAMPPVSLPYQQVAGFGARPIPASVLGASISPPGPTVPGGGMGIQGFSAPGPFSTAVYGFGGGVAPSPQQQIAGAGLAVPYPFVPHPMAAQFAADPSGVVTASSLLAAVALRRGQPQGPTTDAEVEEFVYDALDLLPGAADVEVRCESGRLTLTGSVQHKRTKRDAGEIAWAIPGLQDVQNNLSITSRRRTRPVAGREGESPASIPARKQG
jgi:hypothetical protein